MLLHLLHIKLLVDVYKRQTCTLPPPVAPPFIPKTGPSEGSLNAQTTFLFSLCKPSDKAIEIVVLPSPEGVGVIAVTKINFPSFLSFKRSITFKSTFPIKCP